MSWDVLPPTFTPGLRGESARVFSRIICKLNVFVLGPTETGVGVPSFLICSIFDLFEIFIVSCKLIVYFFCPSAMILKCFLELSLGLYSRLLSWLVWPLSTAFSVVFNWRAASVSVSAFFWPIFLRLRKLFPFRKMGYLPLNFAMKRSVFKGFSTWDSSS